MPRLLPEQVIETCRARPLPTAIPGVPDPLPENVSVKKEVEVEVIVFASSPSFIPSHSTRDSV